MSPDPQHCLAGAEDRHEAEDVARWLAAARRRRRHNVFHEGFRVRQRGAYEEDVVRAALYGVKAALPELFRSHDGQFLFFLWVRIKV